MPDPAPDIAPAPDTGPPAAIEDDLLLLQAARLKGRVTPEIAVPFGADPARLAGLEQAGHLKPGNAGARLTPAGREELARLLAVEREQVDQPALDGLYLVFDAHNTTVKALVSTWQLHPDGTPNDHSDPAYDNDVIEQLAAAHQQTLPLLTDFVAAVPRLRHYPPRLGGALDRARGGEPKFVANPLVDSYHQVWFEFHEDLLGLLGRDRTAETLAGRA